MRFRMREKNALRRCLEIADFGRHSIRSIFSKEIHAKALSRKGYEFICHKVHEEHQGSQQIRHSGIDCLVQSYAFLNLPSCSLQCLLAHDPFRREFLLSFFVSFVAFVAFVVWLSTVVLGGLCDAIHSFFASSRLCVRLSAVRTNGGALEIGP